MIVVEEGTRLTEKHSGEDKGATTPEREREDCAGDLAGEMLLTVLIGVAREEEGSSNDSRMKDNGADSREPTEGRS